MTTPPLTDSPSGLVTFVEASRRHGNSVDWWRRQAKRGAFRTVPFGRSAAIPPDEWARLMREGIGPLPTTARKNTV
jgi:hypothetical protein